MFRKGYYILSIVILIVLYIVGVSQSMDKQQMVSLLIFALISLMVYTSQPSVDNKLRGNFFKPSFFALLGLLIVSFQVYIDNVLGNIPDSASFFWVDQSVVVEGLLLSVLGLNAFLLGVTLTRGKVALTFYRNGRKYIPYRKTTILKVITLFSLVVFYTTVNPVYLSGAYGTAEMGQSATYAALLFSLSVYATIIQNCLNVQAKGIEIKTVRQYIKSQGVFFSILIGIYLIGVLLSGDRGPLITMGLCYSAGYFFLSKKKLKLFTAISFCFIGAFFITLLGIARSLSDTMSFTERVESAFYGESTYQGVESFSPMTLELASSIRTLHHGLAYIPQQHDYLYGRFQFQYVVTSIPFVSMFFPLLFEDNSSKYSGSASFITWIRQGDFPSSGDGTSITADFYCDFGVMGISFGMFLFGIIMGFLDIQFYSGNKLPLIILVFIFIYVPVAIYLSRSALLFSLKTVVWTYLVLYLNAVLQPKT